MALHVGVMQGMMRIGYKYVKTCSHLASHNLYPYV